MVKRTIRETVTEYDGEGKILKTTFTETTEDDDTPYNPYVPASWYPQLPYWLAQPTCTCKNVEVQC